MLVERSVKTAASEELDHHKADLCLRSAKKTPLMSLCVATDMQKHPCAALNVNVSVYLHVQDVMVCLYPWGQAGAATAVCRHPL